MRSTATFYGKDTVRKRIKIYKGKRFTVIDETRILKTIISSDSRRLQAVSTMSRRNIINTAAR